MEEKLEELNGQILTSELNVLRGKLYFHQDAAQQGHPIHQIVLQS